VLGLRQVVDRAAASVRPSWVSRSSWSK
jgi:hypothetical protein